MQRFQNQWEDKETGLYYNLNRYYDPDSGQYLSIDPIGLEGGLRTHGYVHDPMQWADPMGLAGCSVTSEVQSLRKIGAIYRGNTSLRERIHARQEAYYDKLALLHYNGSGKTALGTWPSYIQKAQKTGASYFDIGSEWNKLPKTAKWETNKRFLDKISDAGDQVYFHCQRTE